MSDRKMRFLSLSKISLCLFLLCTTIPEATAQIYRSISGIGNNKLNETLGSAGDKIKRTTDAYYLDGVGKIYPNIEKERPNPRYISNVLFSQKGNVSDKLNHSDFVWMFGQFLDHDITFVEGGDEVLDNIIIPDDDETFKSGSIMHMFRNGVLEGTGEGTDTPRTYQNEITAFVDGSTVYGSDEFRAKWLRTFEGGKLKTSPGNLLPWNTIDNTFNGVIDYDAPHMADDTRLLKKYYVAGDIRANENPLLLTIHTLFLREHNRLCDEFAEENPEWDDEILYQNARAHVVAYIQNITYYEWLPSLGINPTNYSGYQPEVEPRISNEFSAAAFRFGHTLINDTILRIDNKGDILKFGNISLKDAFFNPQVIRFGGGIEAYLRGMGQQVQQGFDCKVIDDVRNFLFGKPGEGGLDLAAININRGRDRGLLPFNQLREQLGLPAYYSIYDLASSAKEAESLKSVYGNIDNIDAWVGMLAEKKEKGKMLGQTVTTIVRQQFQDLRDGDRFYFENDPLFDDEVLEKIRSTSLHDIIMRNASGINFMQKNVFEAMPRSQIQEGPKLKPLALQAKIYPNPIHDNLHIKVYSDVFGTLDVTVIDNLGRPWCKRAMHVYKGNNYLDIPVTDLPRGVYFVKLQHEERMKILKMFKEF